MASNRDQGTKNRRSIPIFGNNGSPSNPSTPTHTYSEKKPAEKIKEIDKKIKEIDKKIKDISEHIKKVPKQKEGTEEIIAKKKEIIEALNQEIEIYKHLRLFLQYVQEVLKDNCENLNEVWTTLQSFEQFKLVKSSNKDEVIGFICKTLKFSIGLLPLAGRFSSSTANKNESVISNQPKAALSPNSIMLLIDEVDEISKKLDVSTTFSRKNSLQALAKETELFSEKKLEQKKQEQQAIYPEFSSAIQKLIDIQKEFKTFKRSNDPTVLADLENKAISKINELMDCIRALSSKPNRESKEAQEYCREVMAWMIDAILAPVLQKGSRFERIQKHLLNRIENLFQKPLQQFEIDLRRDFEKISELKPGQFGSVFLYRVVNKALKKKLLDLGLLDTPEDDIIVVKQFKVENLTKSQLEAQKNAFEKEGNIDTILLRNRSKIESENPDHQCHYNLSIKVNDSDGNPLIMMRRESQGKVSDFLQKYNRNLNKNPITPAALKETMSILISLIHDVRLGLKEIHSIGIMNGDIWPDNILVDTDKNGKLIARLIDFGLGRIFDKDNFNATLKMKIEEPFFKKRNPLERFLGDLSTATDLYSFKIAVLDMIATIGGMDFATTLKEMHQSAFQKSPHTNQKILEYLFGQVKNYFTTIDSQTAALCQMTLIFLDKLEPFFSWQYDDSSSNTNKSLSPKELDEIAEQQLDKGLQEMSEILNSFDTKTQQFSVPIDFITRSYTPIPEPVNPPVEEPVNPPVAQAVNPPEEENEYTQVYLPMEVTGENDEQSTENKSPIGNNEHADRSHLNGETAEGEPQETPTVETDPNAITETNPTGTETTPTTSEEDKGPGADTFVINAAYNEGSFQVNSFTFFPGPRLDATVQSDSLTPQLDPTKADNAYQANNSTFFSGTRRNLTGRLFIDPPKVNRGSIAHQSLKEARSHSMLEVYQPKDPKDSKKEINL